MTALVVSFSLGIPLQEGLMFKEGFTVIARVKVAPDAPCDSLFPEFADFRRSTATMLPDVTALSFDLSSEYLSY